MKCICSKTPGILEIPLCLKRAANIHIPGRLRATRRKNVGRNGTVTWLGLPCITFISRAIRALFAYVTAINTF